MLDKLKKIIEMIRPDLSSYMRFPVEGKVIEVNIEDYVCDVQPLDESMSLLPKCRIISIWASESTRIVILPNVGDKVMVGFENGDHSKAYIQGFFPDQGPEGMLLIEAEKARIKIDQEGKIEIQTEKDIEITCENCIVKANGNIDLGENGAGVVTGGPTGTLPVCFITGAPIPCSATVKAKG
ncbi:hypothetical protein H8D57_01875 [bacterium]|nr:hypothetical protein [bacterium]